MMTYLKALLFALTASATTAAAQQPARLKSVYFNLYTDSLKPVLNYYVNVEGQTVNGNYLPLDSRDIVLTANWGEMRGNEWVIPPVLLFDSVRFTAVSRTNPALRDEIVIWIQKRIDPRDAPGYIEPGSNLPETSPRPRRKWM